MTETGTLVMRRTKRLFPDALARYIITIDGKDVASLKRGERQSIVLPPGRHTAKASIGGSGSPKIQFELYAGDVAYLTVASAVSAVSGLGKVLSGDEYLMIDVRDQDDLADY